MQTVKAASLVLDFDLYPRMQVDSHHLREMCDAERAGHEFPPVIADRDSKRVTDGFHRVRKQLRVYGDDAEISVVFKRYKSDREMFDDAMQYNADHGRALSSYDKAHCVILARRLGIDDATLAKSLRMTIDKIAIVRETKMATTFARTEDGEQEVIAIKRTIRHKAGKPLTIKQREAIPKIGGMEQLFYVNQIILLVENDLLDRDNEELMERLAHLKGII